MWVLSYIGISDNESTDLAIFTALTISRSSEHFFSYPFYAHFPENWFLGNVNAAGNLFKPPYALSSPQSSPGHPATSLPAVKKLSYAVFELHITTQPVLFTPQFIPSRMSLLPHRKSMYPISFSTD